MASGSTVKEEAHRIVDQLPDGATWDDLIYRIYVRQSIETGLQEAREGKLIPHAEILREFGLQE